MSGSATSPALTSFTKGDLVISVYGDGDGSGTYADNQASPIVLEELTQTGGEVGQMTLPQTTTVVNGTTEYGMSGEYGSSSEGTLELSADGKSLTIAGYAVNAATYNNGESNANNVYGNAALAQSTSLTSQSTYTPVARLIADIGADGHVDTSTAIYNIYNGNNPRSVATVDGSSFHISGQGQSGDTTQGVFYAKDGAGAATAIDTGTDTRTVEIYDGRLYVSRDSKQPKGTGTSNISSYGTLPTTATAPVVLPGISQSITLTAAQENTVNGAKVGNTVALSPENFFFANADTLYIADGGNPKEGTIGDGGLQKWIFNGSSWNLQYTLSAGLNLVPNSASSGTTGLIGLTGVVNADGTVSLYATNATIGDLDPTYLYGITDTLSATTPAAGESFVTLVTAAPDTNIRGVALAPSETACFAAGTRILAKRGEVRVEDLEIGDMVITGSARETPITWVGHWRYDLAAHGPARDLRPVRIMAGALGRDLPHTDLYVSPDHALYLDDVLVPAQLLLNGATITQPPRAGSVDYYHVQVEPHDIIFAEGAACESFLDTRGAGLFGKPGALTEPKSWEDACAPLVIAGLKLTRICQALLGRAAELAELVPA